MEHRQRSRNMPSKETMKSISWPVLTLLLIYMMLHQSSSSLDVDHRPEVEDAWIERLDSRLNDIIPTDSKVCAHHHIAGDDSSAHRLNVERSVRSCPVTEQQMQTNKQKGRACMSDLEGLFVVHGGRALSVSTTRLNNQDDGYTSEFRTKKCVRSCILEAQIYWYLLLLYHATGVSVRCRVE